MRLTSKAFPDGTTIPEKYTLDGVNLSPPLAWDDLPARTRSLALVVEDPDAPDPTRPTRTWVHWVLVDLPPDIDGLPEGVTKLPGGRTGMNDWNHASWDGPCPPRGRHRYVFKLYALDTQLGLARPTKHQLEAAMAGHVLAETKLVGTYQRD
jgi:Raf kinase inhibitor-like YbhB/YbcL family protein